MCRCVTEIIVCVVGVSLRSSVCVIDHQCVVGVSLRSSVCVVGVSLRSLSASAHAVFNTLCKLFVY